MTAYDSLHSLLYHERFLFHCDECRKKNHCSHIELPTEFSYEWIYDCIEFTNEISFINSGGPSNGHHLKQLMFRSAVRCSGN
jgi:hypothetical protein